MVGNPLREFCRAAISAPVTINNFSTTERSFVITSEGHFKHLKFVFCLVPCFAFPVQIPARAGRKRIELEIFKIIHTLTLRRCCGARATPGIIFIKKR